MTPSLEVLALWQPGPFPATAGVSFAAAAPPQEIFAWRLDLPASPQQAQQRLAALEAQNQAARTLLNDVPDRLATLVWQAEAGSAAGVSFSAHSLPAPETAFLRELDALRGREQEQLSFGAGPELSAELEQIGAQFRPALTRFFQLLTHLAWIETRREGQLIGQTVVSWTGETSSAWASDPGPGGYALHRRNMTLALASRLTLLRTLIIATRGAAKIGLLLSSTGGIAAVLVLPLVWKYTHQILAEIERYKAVVEEAGPQAAAIVHL